MGAGCSTGSVSPAETKEIKKIEKKEAKGEPKEEPKVASKVERFNTASSGNASYKTVTTNADTDFVDDGSYRRLVYRITDAHGYPSRLLVEPIRLILHYANQPYEEMAIPKDQFAYEDWGIRLPVLQVADSAPGEMFYGPIAIARFLAETY
uniref:GST N-terminal domain-containing protein n=1 Tax=Plectus sambesii TaxID=2011161 RepID=A0A914XQA0_9BILA